MESPERGEPKLQLCEAWFIDFIGLSSTARAEAEVAPQPLCSGGSTAAAPSPIVLKVPRIVVSYPCTKEKTQHSLLLRLVCLAFAEIGSPFSNDLFTFQDPLRQHNNKCHPIIANKVRTLIPLFYFVCSYRLGNFNLERRTYIVQLTLNNIAHEIFK
jgi:hypothetical protein